MWIDNQKDNFNNIDYNKLTNTFSKTSIILEKPDYQIIPNNHINSSEHLHYDEIDYILSNECYEKTRSQTEESSSYDNNNNNYIYSLNLY